MNAATLNPTAFTQSKANTLRKLALPGGVQMCQYANEHEHVFYEEDKIHTFSMYLNGGFQTHRTDKQCPNGAPGHFCLMPAGSYSAWQIGGSQEFFHIYFDDAYIKRLALQNFDVDPRTVSLPQLTFQSSKSLLALINHSLLNRDWSETNNQLLLQHSMQTLLLNVLQTIGINRVDVNRIPKAGLSPFARKQVDEYIRNNLDRQMYLEELAEVAGVSEYHFSRMFKISLADTPQNYISRLRVENLQRVLRTSNSSIRPSMAELALEYGFSSQSHMGRVFKQYTGITPGQFVRLG